jgi:hypothetical protein
MQFGCGGYYYIEYPVWSKKLSRTSNAVFYGSYPQSLSVHFGRHLNGIAGATRIADIAARLILILLTVDPGLGLYLCQCGVGCRDKGEHQHPERR